ncbi:MAG TPA: ATP-grasp domain-containing protein [Vicinamibacterales bacterium]|jgi:predicted ATP-grasp superfamily ATP-dependent carboligase
MTSHDVGVIVLGGEFHGLGVARSVGRHGVPVCVIDDEYSISRFSRYVTHAVRVPDLRDEGKTVDALLEVARRKGLAGWVLYPIRDEIVAALSRHRETLQAVFRLPTPGWQSIKHVWDKRNTYRLASEIGIATPRTWYPQHVDDLENIDAEQPLVVKPAIKEHFIYATKAKAWRANNRDELRERFLEAAAIVPSGEVMVQELIPGDGRQQYAYCAFFKNGEAIGSMTARRRRQHPPEFGRASTFVETVDVPQLAELSRRFLRAIDYYGLVEVEYKLDPRDGVFKLLDVNARVWGYHTLGFEAGVDFPYLQFLDQLGVQVPVCQTRPGVQWIRLVTDMPTAVVEMLGDRLAWQEFIRSLRTFQIESVFCREDLLPGLVELALIPYLYIRRGF